MINKERGECHAFYLTMIFIRNSVFNETSRRKRT